MTRVMIDPNVRVRGQQTFAGVEDADGPLQVDQSVEVYEPESGMRGRGEVVEIDAAVALVYLRVDWSSLRVAGAEVTGNDEAPAAIAANGQRLWIDSPFIEFDPPTSIYTAGIPTLTLGGSDLVRSAINIPAVGE